MDAFVLDYAKKFPRTSRLCKRLVQQLDNLLLAKLLFAVVLADGSTVGANGEGAQKNSFTGADSRSLWDF
jgi:hypothetical protein